MLARSGLPLATPEPLFITEAYNKWYDEIIHFIAHGRVPIDENKSRKVH